MLPVGPDVTAALLVASLGGRRRVCVAGGDVLTRGRTDSLPSVAATKCHSLRGLKNKCISTVCGQEV